MRLMLMMFLQEVLHVALAIFITCTHVQSVNYLNTHFIQWSFSIGNSLPGALKVLSWQHVLRGIY